MTKTERLYYRDATLRAFEATVTAVQAVEGKPAVILDRTAFYPTSGGQPFDTGHLGDAAVIDVRDLGDEVLHVLNGPAPAVGSVVHGAIDWERRFDHMQQHTGQHVLSQAFEATAGLRTVSFHLGTEYCTIDLNTPQLAAEVAARAEETANSIVFEDRLVLVHFAESSDLDRFGLRKPTDRTGEVRIVEVGAFDRSACGGTHVSRTGQIGPIKVRRWERRGDDSRVEFVCGWRAVRDYSAKHQIVRSLAERLSVKSADVLAAVTRALDELERLRDEGAKLRRELLADEADRLAAGAEQILLVDGRVIRLVARALVDRSPDELKRLAQAIVGAPGETAGAVALLGASGADRSSLVFAQTPGLPFAMSTVLASAAKAVGGRGGGTTDLAQGGGPGDMDVALAVELARRALESQSKSVPAT